MPARSHRQLVLKPQDFYLLLALVASGGQGTTYPELAAFTGLSMSEVHAALKRTEAARLLVFEERRPHVLRPALREFLLHGAKYAFPAVRGGMVVGVPTAHAAPPLLAQIAPSSEPPPVWPTLEGKVRGIALIPIYPSAPAAALRDEALYENLALFDALRAGNARERALAQKLFEERL
jgi:hypothetical protein